MTSTPSDGTDNTNIIPFGKNRENHDKNIPDEEITREIDDTKIKSCDLLLQIEDTYKKMDPKYSQLLNNLKDTEIFTKNPSNVVDKGAQFRPKNEIASLYDAISSFTDLDGEFSNNSSILKYFGSFFAMTQIGINNRKELIQGNIDYNLEYLINEDAYKDILALLYLFNFYNITEIGIQELTENIKNGNISTFQQFLEEKIITITDLINEKELDKAFLLIGEFQHIIKIIGRILISAQKNLKLLPSIEALAFYIENHVSDTLCGLLEKYFKNETSYQVIYDYIIFESTKLFKNFLQIIHFSGELLKDKIDNKVLERINKITFYAEEMKKAINSIDNLPNKESELAAITPTLDYHIALITLEKYRQYEHSGIKFTIEDHDNRNSALDQLVKYYNDQFDGKNLKSPDDVISDFADEIDKSENAYMIIGLIYEIIKYGNISILSYWKLSAAITKKQIDPKFSFDYQQVNKNIEKLIKQESKRNSDILKDYHRLNKIAYIDELTDIENKRAHDKECKVMLADINRTKQQDKYYMLIDIDLFKKFNDKYGHQLGDDVLHHVAQVMQKTKRVSDRLFRYGGEEFSFLATANTKEGIKDFAEKIRIEIENNPFIDKNGKIYHITISIGIHQIHHDFDMDTIIKNADIALYNAKNNGRNRAEFYIEGMKIPNKK